MSKSLNIVIGNAKRFMAYEIIKRLEENKHDKLLDASFRNKEKRSK